MGRAAIVLAAGLGTRMKSKHHKVLHKVCGKPMILHILDELEKLKLDQIIVVVGQQKEAVQAAIGKRDRVQFAVQSEQLGTGHAAQVAVPHLQSNIDATVVLYGDAPLVRSETIDGLFKERELKRAAAVALTANLLNPFGLGRVLLDESGMVLRVVEQKDASEEEKLITLVNTGIYAFAKNDLQGALSELKADNAQGEYYLTDTLAILRASGKSVYPMAIQDTDEIASVNDRAQLAEVEAILRRRICKAWMLAGVTIVDPATTYIGTDVSIGRDTVILPGTILEGHTEIGEDCEIGPHTRLVDVKVSDGTTIQQSVVTDSMIGPQSGVGPFAYIRPGSQVGARVKIGDFVELKNSVVGDDSKVSHLAYLGDAQIGQRVNVGCGAITVNYDGKRKHRTVVGDDSFVGSNVNLIAPVTIGDGAYVCAGSTVTDDVPSDGFAIARQRQVTKPNYVQEWKRGRDG